MILTYMLFSGARENRGGGGPGAAVTGYGDAFKDRSSLQGPAP
jgi:hypothetical protein